MWLRASILLLLCSCTDCPAGRSDLPAGPEPPSAAPTARAPTEIAVSCQDTLEYLRTLKCDNRHQHHTYDLKKKVSVVRVEGIVVAAPATPAGRPFNWKLRVSPDNAHWTEIAPIEAKGGQPTRFGPVKVFRLARFVQISSGREGYVADSGLTIGIAGGAPRP